MIGRRQLPAYSPLTAGALAAGAWATVTGGSEARSRVTEALQNALGGPRVLVTDSGTSALTLALRALAADSVGDPPVVALPAYCCYDVATAADGAGVGVMLYDLDPETLGPDWDSLDSVLGAGAGAVVVAHLYGIPVDMGRVATVAGAHGALVIEDAAQGVGAMWAGRPAGSWGSLGVLSFGRGKGVTGSGGGALLANDERGRELVARVRGELASPERGWRALAAGLAQWVLGRPALYAIPSALPFLRLGQTIYRRPHPPAVMPVAVAGVLHRTLPLAPAETEHRKRLAGRLREALGAWEDFEPICAPEGGESGYLRFPLLVAPRAAGEFRSPAAVAAGIVPGYPRVLADLPGFGERCVAGGELGGARRLTGALFTLPVHGRVGEADVEKFMALRNLAGATVSKSGEGIRPAHAWQG